jgi:hypothetical protein
VTGFAQTHKVGRVKAAGRVVSDFDRMVYFVGKVTGTDFTNGLACKLMLAGRLPSGRVIKGGGFLVSGQQVVSSMALLFVGRCKVGVVPAPSTGW